MIGSIRPNTISNASPGPTAGVAVTNAAGVVVGEAPVPIAVVSDNGPCFSGEVFGQAFTGHDPLLRHVRTRVRSPQTNGVVERFFGTLKYEHLYRGVIADGDALSVEISWFRQIYNTIRPPPGPRRSHPA
jgi:transposase InsO family protein